MTVYSFLSFDLRYRLDLFLFSMITNKDIPVFFVRNVKVWFHVLLPLLLNYISITLIEFFGILLMVIALHEMPSLSSLLPFPLWGPNSHSS